MNGAFSTFVSATAVAAACYLLAIASWQQVLLLFLASSVGWCAFAHLLRARSNQSRPQTPGMDLKSPFQPLPPEPVQHYPHSCDTLEAAPPSTARFPIHKLAR